MRFSLSFFGLADLGTRRVWLVSQHKRLKHTNILKQWSFIHCQSSMEHIRLVCQACRILNGTCHIFDKDKNVWHHKHVTNICLVHSHLQFLLQLGIQLDLHLYDVISLGAYHAYHIIYFCKQAFVIGYIWLHASFSLSYSTITSQLSHMKPGKFWNFAVQFLTCLVSHKVCMRDYLKNSILLGQPRAQEAIKIH